MAFENRSITKEESTVTRILIVEDEPKLLAHLVQTMKMEQFSVSHIESFQDLENLIQDPSHRYDVIVLDRLLHGKDSASLVPQIKLKMPDTKVLILSAINTGSEKASLLYLGADDYLSKPFDTEELIARVKVLMRREFLQIQFGNVKLDFHNRTMVVENNEIALPNREFNLLRTFMQSPGRIFSKALLYEQVWEFKSDVESNVVETTVNKLRRRLSEAGATIQIRNSRNAGYWLEE